jgi:hypothetical protein
MNDDRPEEAPWWGVLLMILLFVGFVVVIAETCD